MTIRKRWKTPGAGNQERRYQEEFLREKLAAAGGRWLDLRKKVLRIGGRELVVPLNEHEPHMKQLLSRGRRLTLSSVRQARGLPGECHQNVATLYMGTGGLVQIATGYALSEDGLWRQHSWGMNGREAIETTLPRDVYFGIVLTKSEARKFMMGEIP